MLLHSSLLLLLLVPAASERRTQDLSFSFSFTSRLHCPPEGQSLAPLQIPFPPLVFILSLVSILTYLPSFLAMEHHHGSKGSISIQVKFLDESVTGFRVQVISRSAFYTHFNMICMNGQTV